MKRVAPSLCATPLWLALGTCGPPAPEPPPPVAEGFRFAPTTTTVPAEGAELPCRFVGSLPFVQVAVDELEPLWFLLDTGYDANVVDVRTAARLHGRVAPLDEPATIEAASGATRSLERAVRIERMRIGALEFGGVDAVVDDLAAISVSVEVEIAGILGFNDFGEVALVLDYPAERITVRPAGLATAVEGALALQKGQSLPVVELTVGERTEGFLIDSGSNEFLALGGELASTTAWAFGPRPFARATTAAGESARLQYGRLAVDVPLGIHTLARPIAAVSFAGNRIGGKLLCAFRVTLEAHTATARFERADVADVESSPWRGHGAGWRKVGERVVVLDLVPDSPAELSGLQVGDEVVFHGGGPLDELGACGERHVLAADFDGELVCALRGDERLHFDLANVDLIP